MASSLSRPNPSANMPVRKFKIAIVPSASANRIHTNQGKKTADMVQEALMSVDTKRPWWAPLFRVGGDPVGSERKAVEPVTGSDGSDADGVKSAAYRSRLTAEKARLLRKEMRAMESWHDPMYHSAIAARLASPDQS